MSKRGHGGNAGEGRRGPGEVDQSEVEMGVAGLKFEDDFGDEFEEEVVGEGDAAQDNAMEEENEGVQEAQRLFRAGVDELGEDEQLEYDNSAYIMLHQMKVEYPFLSFDFVRDSLGEQRNKFPKTAFMVGGTQADHSNKHKLMVLKMSDMHRTRKDRLEDEVSLSDSDDSDDDNDDMDDDAVVEFKSIKHTGAVNRVRSMPQHPNVVASWSDTGRVYMWDISRELVTLGAMPAAAAPNAAALRGSYETLPIHSFKGHKDEGYALDWSPVKAGRMASGDCKRDIFAWQVTNTGQSVVDETPFSGHSNSVEDLQWSPTEASVLASCSVDLSVRIWDLRERKKSMLSVTSAHDADVNVISWNKKVPFLIASGGDDGAIKIWDLRMLKQPAGAPAVEPVGHFSWHKAPVTSLTWHPQDDTVLIASGADNQITVWDFGLEEDPEEANKAPKLQDEVIGGSGEKVEIPPQLLFVHEGQKEIKEVRFHPQIPGMIGSTALEGIHLFIPEPLDPKMAQKYLATTTPADAPAAPAMNP